MTRKTCTKGSNWPGSSWLTLSGPKPRRVRDQDVAVERACQRLEASLSPKAGQARYILAVEYAAQSKTQWVRNASRRIEERDWRLALEVVRSLPEEDLRRYARGGLSIRATLGGWQEAQ